MRIYKCRTHPEEHRCQNYRKNNNDALEMHINSNVIGVAHIGLVLRDTKQDEKASLWRSAGVQRNLLEHSLLKSI